MRACVRACVCVDYTTYGYTNNTTCIDQFNNACILAVLKRFALFSPSVCLRLYLLFLEQRTTNLAYKAQYLFPEKKKLTCFPLCCMKIFSKKQSLFFHADTTQYLKRFSRHFFFLKSELNLCQHKRATSTFSNEKITIYFLSTDVFSLLTSLMNMRFRFVEPVKSIKLVPENN